MRLNIKQMAFLPLFAALVFAISGCEDSSQTNIPADKEFGAPEEKTASTTPGFGEAQGVNVDGTPINKLAKAYYVVLDGSGSMQEAACSDRSRSKSEASKEALVAFAGFLPEDAVLGLLVFDNRGITERVPLGLHNRDEFVAAVNDAHADSGTPLASAISEGYKALDGQAALQQGYGEYHLVVVTDGEANFGEDPSDVVDTILKQSPIIVHTIGFCIGSDHSLNQPGRTYYAEANSPEELQAGLKGVLAEQEISPQDLMKE